MAVFVLGAGATRGASFVGSGQTPCLPPLDADFFGQLQRIESSKHAATIQRTLRDLDRLFGSTYGLTLETAFSTVETTIRMVRTANESTDFELGELAEMRSGLLQAVAAVLEESLTTTRRGHRSRDFKECSYHDWLVDQMRSGDTTISYNYDCLIDHALRMRGAGKWNAYYGYFVSAGEHVDTYVVRRSGDRQAVDDASLHGVCAFARSQASITARRYNDSLQGGPMRYRIAIHQSDEGYSVSVPGLPGCWSQGATDAEAVENIKDAIREYLAVVEEQLRGEEIREIDVAV